MIAGTEAEYQSDAGSTKYTPYLALMGELWGVFCEYLWENWPRYNGTALYQLQLSQTLPMYTWWHHHMESLSTLLTLCEGNPPATGRFPSQRDLWCFFICDPEESVEHIVYLLMIWDAKALIWHYCNDIPMFSRPTLLTQWGWVTHICISKLTTIGSDNGLSCGRCQAIIWINAAILSIWSLGTNFSDILIKIHIFSFKKMHLKMLSWKWRSFCLSLNVLNGIVPPCLWHTNDNKIDIYVYYFF